MIKRKTNQSTAFPLLSKQDIAVASDVLTMNKSEDKMRRIFIRNIWKMNDKSRETHETRDAVSPITFINIKPSYDDDDDSENTSTYIIFYWSHEQVVIECLLFHSWIIFGNIIFSIRKKSKWIFFLCFNILLRNMHIFLNINCERTNLNEYL